MPLDAAAAENDDHSWAEGDAIPGFAALARRRIVQRPRGRLHFWIAVPGEAPMKDVCAIGCLISQVRQLLHLSAVAALIWSHGAYSEEDTRLSFVWGIEIDALALTIDRCVLDRLGDGQCAPNESNILAALARELIVGPGLLPFMEVVEDAAREACSTGVAPGVLRLHLAFQNDATSMPRLPDISRSEECSPLTDPAVFVFLGLTPPQIPGLWCGQPDASWIWPGLGEPGGKALAVARAIHTLQHLHVLGRLKLAVVFARGPDAA